MNVQIWAGIWANLFGDNEDPDGGHELRGGMNTRGTSSHHRCSLRPVPAVDAVPALAAQAAEDHDRGEQQARRHKRAKIE